MRVSGKCYSKVVDLSFLRGELFLGVFQKIFHLMYLSFCLWSELFFGHFLESFQEERYCVPFFEGTAFLSERYDFLGCISCVKSPYVSKKASPIVFMLLSMERSIFWLFSLESLQESKSHVAYML